MKKYLLVVLAILLVGVAAGGGAWYWRRSHDQLGLAREAMRRGDLRTAQISLRTAVRSNPQSGEAHYRLGAVQLQLGDPVSAEKELRLAQASGWNPRQVTPLLARTALAQGHFQDVLSGFPIEGLPPEEAAAVLVARALAHLGLHEIPAAEQDAAEAERLGPQLVEVPLAAARVALASNDSAAAEKKVDRALEINPRSVDALLLKGGLLHARGDDEGAVATFTAALAIVPDAVNVRLERANSLIGLNQDQKARDDVDAVLKADARNPLGNYFLTVLLVRARDWSGADAALQKISPVISRFPRGDYFQAMVKINLGQTEQALDAATKYGARDPRDIAGYKLLARIQGQAGQPLEMVKVLQRAIDRGLADAELLELLGGAYIRTGQTQRALETFDKAAAMASGNPEVLSRIGAARLGIGDAGGAEREFARSLELAPDRTETGERLVIASLAAGDVDRAAAEIDTLRQQSGIDPGKLGNLLGLVRLGQLDLDGARTAFEGVLAADPTAAAARLNLARVMVLQNHAEDAEKLLLAVLEKDPANTAALSAMSGILIAGNHADRLVALVEAARRAAPGNVGLSVALAELLANSGDAKKALAVIEGIPKEQAALPRVIAVRARLQQGLGQTAEAAESWRRLIVANPGEIEGRRQLADLLLRGGDAKGARAVLSRGLEAVPGNAALLQAAVGIDFRAGGLEAGLATADALARAPSNLPAARLLKGGLYMSVQRFADAASAYQAALDAAPSPVLAIATSTALNSAGRTADAQKLLQGWISAHPQDAGVIQALASLDLQAHRTADAEQHLLAVLALRPNDAVALNNLAWIYQGRDDPRARAMAQKAYLLVPGPQEADTLGWIMTKGGNPQIGTLLLGQAARQLTNDPTVFYHLAVALNATGQKTTAATMLAQITSAPGAFDDKPAAQKLLEELGGPPQ